MNRETGERACGVEQAHAWPQVENDVSKIADQQPSDAGLSRMNLALTAERDHYKDKCQSLDRKISTITGSTTYKVGSRIRSLVYGPLDLIVDRFARRDYLREIGKYPVLSDELSLHPVSVDVPTHLACCNPSIIATAEGWLCTVRTHNLVPVRDGSEYRLDGNDLVNENWLLCLNDDLTVIHRQAIVVASGGCGVDADSLRRIAANGLEDVRLFMFGGAPYALASAARFSSRTSTMTLCRFLGARLDVLEELASPWGERQEKNWMPLIIGKRMYAVYSVNPFILLEVGKGGIRLVAYRPVSSRTPYYSGSSQLLPYEDGWLCVAHRCSRVFGRKYYVHRFITFNTDWSIGSMSPEFFIEERGIEFCAGIASKGDRIVMSYGVRDAAARLVELSSSQMRYLLTRSDGQ